MDRTFDVLSTIDQDAKPAPVVLPLPPPTYRVPAENYFAFPELPATTSEPAADDPIRAGQESCGAGVPPAPCNRDGSTTMGPDGRTAERVIVWPECGCEGTIEACADLAKDICQGFSPGRPAVLAFTTPSDDDDATALLLALAPQLAQRMPGGILVADADPDRATLAERLSISAGDTAHASPSVCPTNVPGLNVRPVSKITAACIDGLRETWPLVVLNAMSLEHDEAEPILARCDGVYLVVRVGYTKPRAIRRAVGKIHDWGLELLGCVAMTPEGPVEPF